MNGPTHKPAIWEAPLSMLIIGFGALVVITLVFTPASVDPAPAPVPGTNVAYVPFLFIDQVTGCHYLSTHNSAGLAPRIAPDGRTHMGCSGGRP